MWDQKFKLSTKIFHINLSDASVNSYQFELFLKEQLERYSFPEETICFAITEVALLANVKKIKALMSNLKNQGCLLALDNFGQEFSSLNCLKNLPIDYLKIDGSLIHNLVDNPINYVTVQSISQISQLMKIKTIAKDIENEFTVANLKKIGVDFGQGEQFAKSQPLSFI